MVIDNPYVSAVPRGRLKSYERRSQAFKRCFRKSKHTKEHINKDFIGYFAEKF